MVYYKDDLEMFKLDYGTGLVLGFIGISGITADEIRFAVLAEDIKAITKAQDICPMTAKSYLSLRINSNWNQPLSKSFQIRLEN